MSDRRNVIRAAIFRLRRVMRNLKIAALLTVLFCSALWAEDEKPALSELKEIVVAGPY